MSRQNGRETSKSWLNSESSQSRHFDIISQWHRVAVNSRSTWADEEAIRISRSSLSAEGSFSDFQTEPKNNFEYNGGARACFEWEEKKTHTYVVIAMSLRPRASYVIWNV